MKRKDLDDTSLYNDFIDISLSSCYSKLRRLTGQFKDGNLYMNVGEEENARASMLYDQGLVSTEQASTSSRMVEEETPVVDDRAIVLYKPANTPLIKSPSSSDFLFVLNSELVPGLKNLVFLPGKLNPATRKEEEAATGTAEKKDIIKDYLAVVPWVASQFPPSSGFEEPVIAQAGPTEAEEEVDMMEEDTIVADSGRQAFGFGGLMGGGEWLNLWQQQQQQQHFLLPQLLRNASSTSVTWPQIGKN
ncbi:uncharacterized protein LOC132284359 [Cornus florida]|uniref:uncharacterized protein LOC132284359 n=1 Tax=Cornus florida TaxID=4283 RepID=UPI0028968F89|nr:uncharacterized protein LOC132284359 [Cornus florida]